MLRPRAAFRISSDRNNRAARCGLAARPYATGTNAGGQTRWRSSGPGQSSALGPRRDLAYLGAFPLSVEHISVERFSSWTSVGALHTSWSSRAARLLSSRVTLYSRPGNDRFSLVVEAYLIELFHHACRMGLEGIVSKGTAGGRIGDDEAPRNSHLRIGVARSVEAGE